MTNKDKVFYQGFGASLAGASRHSVDSSFVLDVMSDWGVNMEELEEAGVDGNDLQEILSVTKFYG